LFRLVLDLQTSLKRQTLPKNNVKTLFSVYIVSVHSKCASGGRGVRFIQRKAMNEVEEEEEEEEPSSIQSKAMKEVDAWGADL
jgi:hypothetical protein